MKELERQQLQDVLHKDVMRKIIFLQRRVRAHLQRKEFLEMRQAAVTIQVNTDPIPNSGILRRVLIVFTVVVSLSAFMASVPQRGAKAAGGHSDPGGVERP